MSRLTDFYRGTRADNRGRALAELWEYSDDQLESAHDFIQWLFPLRDPSGFNPLAPLLTDEDVAAFRSDPNLREHLRRSLDVFLGFLGLRLEDGRVTRAPDFEAKQYVWLYPNHNWLRITRVLASTRILGLDEESRAFFAFLTELRDGGRSGITADSFGYWERAGEAH